MQVSRVAVFTIIALAILLSLTLSPVINKSIIKETNVFIEKSAASFQLSLFNKIPRVAYILPRPTPIPGPGSGQSGSGQSSSSSTQSSSSSSTTLVSCTSTPGNNLNSTIIGYIYNLSFYVWIGVLISFLILGVAYMIKKIYPSKSFNEFFEEELRSAVESLIIIGMVVGLILFIGDAAGSISANIVQSTQTSGLSLSGKGVGLLYSSTCYDIGYILAQTYNIYSYIIGASEGAATASSGSLTFDPIYPLPFTLGLVSVEAGGSEPLGQNTAYFYLFSSSLSTVGFLNLITYIFEYYAFYLIVGFGFGVALPLGIIFRSFTFLRDIGNSLIGIAIGIMLVYPALVSLFIYPIFNFMFNNLVLPAEQSINAISQANFLSFIGNAVGFIGDLLTRGNSFTTGALSCSNALTANPQNIFSYGLSIPFAILNYYITDIYYGFDTTFGLNYNCFVLGYTEGFYYALSYGISNLLTIFIIGGIPLVILLILDVFAIIMGVIIVDNITRALGGELKKRVGSIRLV
ncbi:MAG: hypothetical protein ARM1_0370 [Candidatus Micrarchaeota archaeon]|nr:MAG: hypothetical protein ARM1_0370 [Candidatus Micrarchaeota archaeon]